MLIERDEERNLRSLLLYSCSIIVVCLNVFNLYLFAWVWSSLSGSGSSPTHSLQWAKIDFVSSWGSIKFPGKLTSKRPFKMVNIQALQEEHQQDDTTGAGWPPKLLRILSNQSIDLSASQGSLLSLNAERIAFTAGLMVVASNQDSSQQASRLVCLVNETKCELEAPRIRFTSARGLDFEQRPMQTRKLAAQRIHSPTRQLSLASQDAGKFESIQRAVKLQALDHVSLFSMKSFVSVLAKLRTLSPSLFTCL